LTKYSTRRNSQGLVDFIPEPEKVYRRRLNKLTSRRILDHLGFESISDIHLLFNNSSLEMDDYFSPLIFLQLMVILMLFQKKLLKNYLLFKEIMQLAPSPTLKLFPLVLISGVVVQLTTIRM
jgi:hypothetical protein